MLNRSRFLNVTAFVFAFELLITPGLLFATSSPITQLTLNSFPEQILLFTVPTSLPEAQLVTEIRSELASSACNNSDKNDPLNINILTACNSGIDINSKNILGITYGTQSNAGSAYSHISEDGRFVAFRSSSDNIVPNDTNAADDVFVYDRQNGTTERVSVSSDGTQTSYGLASDLPSISANGRFVAFESSASNLVPGDINNGYDVYVRDRQNGTTERVSVSSNGISGNASSRRAKISADGRFVAFVSFSSNLVPEDQNPDPDIYVRDRLNGTTERLSVSINSSNIYLLVTDFAVSADGRYIVFSSDSNLVPGDTNGLSDIYVRDRLNGTTERLSIYTDGSRDYEISISADAHFIAFNSVASDLVANDTNQQPDIFVRDRLNGTNERVSVGTSGIQSNSEAFFPSISANGRFVVFDSVADNLVPNDTNAAEDVFVHDRLNGTTERVSVSSNGAQANSYSLLSTISADGRFVAFESEASNLVSNDTNASRDIFVRDRINNTTERVSIGSGTTPTLASLSISSVSFKQQHVSTPANWDDVPSGGTTDGNIVKINVNISNQGGSEGQFVVRARETITNKVVGEYLSTTTLGPGQSTKPPIQMYWDTTGYAWNDDGSPKSEREVQIELLTPNQQTTITSKKQNFIVIRPKPVIFVHGIFSTYCTWNEYKGLIKEAHNKWIGYAVGDGDTNQLGYNGYLDMGLRSSDCSGRPINIGITHSLVQNAKILSDYIQAVRNHEDAWYVDLVGHSMGGLVSRQYIQQYMPLVSTPIIVTSATGTAPLKPVVQHLIMLGTPNGGAKCADLAADARGFLPFGIGLLPLLQPMNNELTTDYISLFFNPTVYNDPQSVRYVPFYLVAGNTKPTCLDKLNLLFPGDGYVEYRSAAQTIPLYAIGPVDAYHVNDDTISQVGVTNKRFFWGDVKRWLALGPSSSLTNAASSLTFADATLPLNVEPQAIQPEPQVILGQQVDLLRGATLNIPITIPSATLFGVTIVTGPAIEASLINPSGIVSDSIAANSPESHIPFETLVVENPATGAWNLRLTNRGTSTETILVSAVVIGSTVQLSASFDAPDIQRRVQMIGMLTDSNNPITGATLTAKIFTSTGTTEGTLTLLDDGLNGDGAANDGVYGKLSNPLSPGIHNVSVTATGAGFTRSTGGLVEVKSLDVALTNSASHNPVFPGTNLTYTLAVSNAGPSDATGVVVTDTLPSGVTFVSATSSLGDICTQVSSVVTCDVGTVFSSSNVTITIVVTTTTEGLITNAASVTANEAETNNANNSDSVDTTVAITPPASAPVLLSPDNGFVTSAGTPLFSWNETDNATSYEIQIDNNAVFDSPEQDQTVGVLSYQATTLVDDTYYWQVRAVNSAGNGDWSTSRSFTVDTVAPAAPTLLAPVNQLSTTNTKPVFTWSSVPNVDHYEMRLDSVNPPINTVYNGTSLTYTPTVALIPTTYYWQVAAVDAAGNLSPVETRTLIIISPDNAAPSRNYFTTTTPTLSWSRVSTATGYIVQVSTSLTFTNSAYSANVPAGQLSVTTDSLAEGVYYWRVSANGGVTWSAVDSFTIDTP